MRGQGLVYAAPDEWTWMLVAPIVEAIAWDIASRVALARERQAAVLVHAAAIADEAPCHACGDPAAEGWTIVGWTAPPHPIDYVPSLNPSDSFQEQARGVLMSFHYDDATHNWFDQGNVKDAFKWVGAYSDKGGYDVTSLIHAYEHKNDPVWARLDHASGNPVGTGWHDLDQAVRGAIARRKQLGTLPTSSYDTDPIVIYYYDNDRMKKIVWPKHDVYDAIDPNGPHQPYYWRVGDVFTYETQDPKKIAAERKDPGAKTGCYASGNRDDCRAKSRTTDTWGDEGFDVNKDFPGNADAVFTAIATIVMEIVGAVLDVTGVGAALGIALNIVGAALPAIVGGIAGVIDAAFQGTDNAAALLGIAKALLTAASAGFKAETGVTISSESLKALSNTVTSIAQALDQAQKQKLDYTQSWNKVAAKVKSLHRITDEDAHAIMVLLGPTQAGKLFMQGFTIGKLASMAQIGAVAKMVEAYSQLSRNPAAMNIFLLGAGVGHVAAVQKGSKPAPLPAAKRRGSIAHHAAVFGDIRPRAATTRTSGAFTRTDADLHEFVGCLAARYAPGTHVGQDGYATPCASSVLENAHAAKDALDAWLLHQPWGARSVLGIDSAGYPLLRVLAPTITSDMVALVPRSVCGVTVRLFEEPASFHVSGDELPPPPDWSALGKGCPDGYYFDPLEGVCRPIPPPPPPGFFQ